jgi:hypothetical protein
MKKSVYILNAVLIGALLLAALGTPAWPVATAAPQSPDEVAAMPPPIIEFAGIARDDAFNDPGLVNPDAVIPDTSGVAGHTHYLQAVNTSLALYRKNGLLFEGTNFNTFWGFAATGTICDDTTAHHGQPSVIYDPLPRRWVVLDVAYTDINNGPYYLCTAISNGLAVPAAPPYFTNTYWNYYAIQTTDYLGDELYPDMPKLALWNNSYFISANLIDVEDSGTNRTNRGVQVWALQRDFMLAGSPTIGVVTFYLPEQLDYRNLVPTNLLGVPEELLYGAPNYFASIEPGRLFIWKFTVDWLNPSAATFGNALRPNYSLTTDTADIWSVGHVIPQLGTTEQVESHGDRLMTPMQYRIVDGVPSLWLTHTVAPFQPDDSRTGLRWYEIQFAADGTPAFYQTGTFMGPEPTTDTAYRWLPSLAVDKAGDMAIGYSLSDPSNLVYPSIRYAGRLRSSYSGQLPLGEATLYSGTTFQDNANGVIDGPWGRQSHMSIDPLDECVFWYTNMYYDANADVSPNINWRTRIGWFSLTECRGGMTTRVSLSSSNAQGNAPSGVDFGQYGMDSVAISANGRYVAFSSEASNLVTGDTNNFRDIFIRDRDTDGDGIYDEPGFVETRRVVPASGVQPNGPSWEVSMSYSGRYIAFSSDATNWVAGDTNGSRDVFVYDRQTGLSELISARDGTTATFGNSRSDQPFISGNGRYVAFRSTANNLLTVADGNTVADIFIRDLWALPRRTYRISVLPVSLAPLTGESATPTLSEDGYYIAFATKDINLGPAIGVADANYIAGVSEGWDVFLAYWPSLISGGVGALTAISTVPGGGSMGNRSSYTPFISGDAQHVAFVSESTDLDTLGELNFDGDIFVWDNILPLPVVQRISINFFGLEANGSSYSPSITTDGQYVVFTSEASNLDSFFQDVNGRRDVFLHDRSMVSEGVYEFGLTQRISLDTNRSDPNNASFGPMIAPYGRHVAYVSAATDLVTNDTNSVWDVFAHDSQRTLPIFLRIPGNIPGSPGELVSVPITFDPNDQAIDTTAFSVDYDEVCLQFDPTVSNPVVFSVPADFTATYSFNAADTDGELDFSIYDQVAPRSSLPAGTLATIRLRVRATCAALPGSTTAARVGFSYNPPPSFGSFGQSVKGLSLDGFVTIREGLLGDCNGDNAVNAGDLTAFVLEFFDGDDVWPWNVPFGTFPGNPVGCNPNQDEIVDAGDLSCTVLIIFGGGSAGCAGGTTALQPTAALADVSLSLPESLPTRPGSTVVLPVSLNKGGNAVGSLVFSLDIDQTWLTFNPADANGDGMPDAASFNLPAGFVAGVTYNAADTDGELDVVVYSLSNPLVEIPDGAFLNVRLTAGGPQGAFLAQVKSSDDPAASFGSLSGTSLPGLLQDGSVWISQLATNLFLPWIRR